MAAGLHSWPLSGFEMRVIAFLRAEYPQDQVDAALAAFAAIAGAENAAMLSVYVAAVLGRPPPAGAAAEPLQDSGTASVADGAGASSSAAVDQASAGAGAPGNRADSAAPAAANPESAGGAGAAAPYSTPASGGAAARPQQSHRHWPCSIVLNPIADKTVRTAVHKFFQEDRRIPAFRTETAQQQKKSTKASVRRRHLLRLRCCLFWPRMQAFSAMKIKSELQPHPVTALQRGSTSAACNTIM